MSYRAVWRSAHQLILDHCDDALVKAAMNADDALARGQLDAYKFWRTVIKAIADMGRRVPVNGERLN
jgi:hypothetical protein